MEIIKNMTYGQNSYTECSRDYLLAAGVPGVVIDEAQLNQQVFFAQQARRLAYVAESDPLFVEWQYDQTEASEKVWRDKVAEIKHRFPLPEVK